jgi:hypothetical protein
MSGLLSTISGYFTKVLILGTLLPVSVFVIAFIVLVLPLLPTGLQILAPVATLDTQWQVVAVTFFTVLLSGLLFNLNIPVIQLFEGYPWQKTWLGKRRTRHYQLLFERSNVRVRGMRTLLRAMTSQLPDAKWIASLRKALRNISVDPDILNPQTPRSRASWNERSGMTQQRWEEIYNQIQAKWNQLHLELYSEFPTLNSLILPTRLGNVIRSFEYYPDREYGMDAVTTWSRLIAKIDPSYAASIDDAKTSFDFMINISFLSAILFLIQVLAGVVYRRPLVSPEALSSWLLQLVTSLLLMAAFYKLSISRAAAWGEMVKGAFDLYRKELLLQLGYQRTLTTKEEERGLWDKISIQMLYGDRPEGPQAPDYMVEPKAPVPPFFVKTEPPDIDLKIARGVEDPFAKGKTTIIVHIKNVDKKNRTAKKVFITDTVASGREYQWDSARINGHSILVEGSNPYRFYVGTLASRDEVLLKYKTIHQG